MTNWQLSGDSPEQRRKSQAFADYVQVSQQSLQNQSDLNTDEKRDTVNNGDLGGDSSAMARMSTDTRNRTLKFV